MIIENKVKLLPSEQAEYMVEVTKMMLLELDPNFDESVHKAVVYPGRSGNVFVNFVHVVQMEVPFSPKEVNAGSSPVMNTKD